MYRKPFQFLVVSSDVARRGVTTFAKPRIVIIGAGWAGFRAATDLDKSKFDVTVVSPRFGLIYDV
jgi:NADPH-dependent 2,4-dienoyl-CoA reductase/sulfur reductase-like enzyme